MLSKRQQDTLTYIRNHFVRNGEAPSLVEIAKGTGIRSKTAAYRHVQSLADAGFIGLLPGRKRGIRLIGETEASLLELPLAGCIAAGRPIEAIPGQDSLNLAEHFLGPDRFALQVQGVSMVDAGILDGDTVVVQQTSTAGDGDIVVALIDSYEATLKRLKLGRNTITLIPENKKMKPMTYDAERVVIQGIVVGQMRRY